MNIVLLDMDGVLLSPGGYHRALQETVRLMGRAMGFSGSTLLAEDIAHFEAVGITNEWDSSAISSVMLLMTAWQQDPHASYPRAVNEQPATQLGRQSPDLGAFFAAVAGTHLNGLPPLARAQKAVTRLSQALAPHKQDQLLRLLQDAHDLERALTKRTFQELVLGSQRYREISKSESVLDTGSYLLKYDRSNVSAALREGLLAWLELPDHHAIIFTNRPSLSPQGHTGTPEAEIGAELVGLGELPYVAFGSLQWLAEELGMSDQDLIKPAPVHALAAMRLALGDPLEDALRTAAELALRGLLHASWRHLEGARISVFEDSVGGIRSLMSARSVLAAHGVKLQAQAYGVARAPLKRTALKAEGGRVCDTFEEAFLQQFLAAEG